VTLLAADRRQQPGSREAVPMVQSDGSHIAAVANDGNDKPEAEPLQTPQQLGQ
jgi:hypothetical protein